MEKNSIILIKLIDGTDIIGRAITNPNNGDSIKLEYPAIFIDIYLESGGVAQSLSAYSKFSKNDMIVLSQSHIISIQDPFDSVKTYYETYINYLKTTNYLQETVDKDSTEASNLYKSLIDKYISQEQYTEGIETGSFDDMILYNMPMPSKSLN
jgi:hypothetical protein